MEKHLSYHLQKSANSMQKKDFPQKFEVKFVFAESQLTGMS